VTVLFCLAASGSGAEELKRGTCLPQEDPEDTEIYQEGKSLIQDTVQN
jgi:hypothetical protein